MRNDNHHSRTNRHAAWEVEYLPHWSFALQTAVLAISGHEPSQTHISSFVCEAPY